MTRSPEDDDYGCQHGQLTVNERGFHTRMVYEDRTKIRAESRLAR